jgi:hypothetical protein
VAERQPLGVAVADSIKKDLKRWDLLQLPYYHLSNRVSVSNTENVGGVGRSITGPIDWYGVLIAAGDGYTNRPPNRIGMHADSPEVCNEFEGMVRASKAARDKYWQGCIDNVRQCRDPEFNNNRGANYNEAYRVSETLMRILREKPIPNHNGRHEVAHTSTKVFDSANFTDTSSGSSRSGNINMNVHTPKEFADCGYNFRNCIFHLRVV